MTKSSPSPVKYPLFREEILGLVHEDQRVIRENFHRISLIKSKDEREREYLYIAQAGHVRADRLSEILDVIKLPTISNIGVDGSQAVATLALHSYLDLLKRVLGLFERQFEINPEDICCQSIPSLKDRVMILEHKKQLYGTNWMVDNDSRPFLVYMDDFEGINERRAVYGLKPVNRPTNLAIGAVKYPSVED